MANFNLFNKKTAKTVRAKYVTALEAEDAVNLKPCSKFIACMEKLSKEYVLFLRDGGDVGTAQVANLNDITFHEGYELAPNYTDSVRAASIRNSRNSLFRTLLFLNLISLLENRTLTQDKSDLNEIKMQLRVMNNVLTNIYQSLTMTDDMPKQPNETIELPADYNEALKLMHSMANELTFSIIKLNKTINIDHINRQLHIITHMMHHIKCTINELQNYNQ